MARTTRYNFTFYMENTLTQTWWKDIKISKTMARQEVCMYPRLGGSESGVHTMNFQYVWQHNSISIKHPIPSLCKQSFTSLSCETLFCLLTVRPNWNCARGGFLHSTVFTKPPTPEFYPTNGFRTFFLSDQPPHDQTTSCWNSPPHVWLIWRKPRQLRPPNLFRHHPKVKLDQLEF